MLSLLTALCVTAAPRDVLGFRTEALGWGRRFFGDEAAQVLEHATRVDAFRLVPHTEDAAWRTGEKKAVEKFAGYVVTARTGPLPIAFLPRLAAALLSDDTDRQPRTHPEARVIRKKFCGGIHPGLGFRFTRGQRTVEVLVCFICDDVGVVRGMTDKGKGLDYWPVDDLDQSAPLDLTVDDSALGRRNLLLLAVDAFPKDEALRELLRAELAGPPPGDE